MPRLAASIVALLVIATIAPAAVSAAPARVATSAAPATSASTAAVLEGIDVSHWQGTITWSSVAAAGKKFAIIKASEDVDFVDDHYLTNRAGAQAVGIWTGAYHFARPDATANDAINEADHFVATVRLGVHDLIPALDLEDAGGLSVTALQAWVTTWLNRVTARIGIRPMIYVSPAFWTKYMGDTRALADAGYRTLWIAHWGVTSPTVPASNWGGRGWTFWQYSNSGSVAGISGRVDLDRFNGTNLLSQAYSVFSLTAKPGSQVKQGQTGAAATVGIARTNFQSEVALDVSGLPAGASATFVDSPTTDTAATMHVTTDAGSTPTGVLPVDDHRQRAGPDQDDDGDARRGGRNPADAHRPVDVARAQDDARLHDDAGLRHVVGDRTRAGSRRTASSKHQRRSMDDRRPGEADLRRTATSRCRSAPPCVNRPGPRTASRTRAAGRSVRRSAPS